MQQVLETYPIIGMSPGNSYFKDDEIRHLLKTVVERFGRTGILIADVPAIATYIALGYPENRARHDKAIPKGNALKNRVRKLMQELGYSDMQVRIFEWSNEIESNQSYLKAYQKVAELYQSNPAFRAAAQRTTRVVLEGSSRGIADLEAATDTAVHYLLSEIAFLEFAPVYLAANRVSYVYHKNWRVFEDYIAGAFDGIARSRLDFLLLENPYETYRPLLDVADIPFEGESYADALDRIEKTKILRVGFANYFPAFTCDEKAGAFSGIFHEVLMMIAEKQGWALRYTEETGYGVIVDGLRFSRFDIFGSTVWPTPERRAQADFSNSLYSSPVFAWARADHSTPNELLQTGAARIAVKENDISDSIANSDFSLCRRIRVPQLASVFEVLQFVADGRADITFAEPLLVDQFNAASPVRLAALSNESIRNYENAFMLKLGEGRLRDFLNAELALLRENGILADLLRKYIPANSQ